MLYLFSFLLLCSFAVAKPISPQAANAGARSSSNTGKPASEGVTTFDGQSLAAIPAAPAPEDVIAGNTSISQAGWIVTADSQEDINPATDAIDGNMSTFWHSEYTPDLLPLPHTFTINMGSSYLVGRMSYLPRQDGNSNGNIGEHIIQLGSDGVTYTTVAFGRWIDDNSLKTTIFTPTNAQYMRIQALSEAGNRGPWSSAAEINIYTAEGTAPPSPVGMGAWGPTINFPLVPVSAAIEWSTGNLLVWSSYNPSTFGGSNYAQTITATYSPASQSVSEALITNTDHDMFCEGLSMNFNGQPISTGGNTDDAVSVYDSPSNAWSAAAQMQIPRGYQSQATTSDGDTFVIGGSWSGGEGGKNGELYDQSANTWTLLPGCPVAPMLTADAQGVYRSDNHAWLFGWSAGYVLQAGPSVAMNWYDTIGTGNQIAAGSRTGDSDAMCGDAIMYDAVNGKILAVGGAVDYQDADATSNAHIITIGAPPNAPIVQTIESMSFARSFANGVVLPDGTVFITGGQSYPVPFSDDTAQFTPELFDPTTNTFRQLAPMAIPRNYHSTALLMPDGTVANAGGGLCGDCATNHYDAQIFSPPYLYDASGAPASRPTITAISTGSVSVGGTFSITTNIACTSFSIIRLSSTTHTVNTDQRFIGLTPTGTSGTTYSFTVPADPGVALPGFWYVWALDQAGVPSLSETLQIVPVS